MEDSRLDVLSSASCDLTAWRAEVSALTQLRHPHIVQCLGAVVEPPTHCLVLEYCEGGDVRSALQKLTPPGFALHVAEGVASGMAFLHRKGIMHRDLKSANVLIVGSSTSALGAITSIGNPLGPPSLAPSLGGPALLLHGRGKSSGQLYALHSTA